MTAETLATGKERGIYVKAFYLGERIDIRAIKRTKRIASNPALFSYGDRGWAVIFRYGVMVCFSPEKGRENDFLLSLEGHISGSFDEPATEEIKVVISPEEKEGARENGIVLRSADTERLQLVAEALSRDVVLDHYEQEVSKSFDAIDPMTANLQKRFQLFHRMRTPVGQIAASLMILHKMVGRVTVSEKPDLLWDRPELESLYLLLEDEYEIRERHDALERKIDLISRTSQTVLNLLQTKQTIRVEWYIVILIVVEIMLTLYELFYHG
ncbi:MAG: RMD1 family protein [bacterium]|nr:RMD1 family protein [bacterium]